MFIYRDEYYNPETEDAGHRRDHHRQAPQRARPATSSSRSSARYPKFANLSRQERPLEQRPGEGPPIEAGRRRRGGGGLASERARPSGQRQALRGDEPAARSASATAPAGSSGPRTSRALRVPRAPRAPRALARRLVGDPAASTAGCRFDRPPVTELDPDGRADVREFADGPRARTSPPAAACGSRATSAPARRRSRCWSRRWRSSRALGRDLLGAAAAGRDPAHLRRRRAASSPTSTSSSA